MPQVIEPSEALTSQPVRSKAPESKEGTGRYVQEKIMVGLALVFFLGVFALTVVPTQFTGVAMGLIVFLTLVAMFRFN